MTSGTPAQVMRFLLVWDQARPRNGVMDESPVGNWVAFGDYDRLAHRVEQLEAALQDTLDALCAADTSCERVHHSKVDQHSGTSCPVERRFSEIETRARAALSGVSP